MMGLELVAMDVDKRMPFMVIIDLIFASLGVIGLRAIMQRMTAILAPQMASHPLIFSPDLLIRQYAVQEPLAMDLPDQAQSVVSTMRGVTADADSIMASHQRLYEAYESHSNTPRLALQR